MQQIGQIWGPESDIGPKIRNFGIWPVEDLKILKMYRILAFFEVHRVVSRQLNKLFFNSVKIQK